MTDQYTNEIRTAYVEYCESADFPTQKYYQEWKATGGAEGEFDRWLAEHDREVEARGLEKAARQMPFPVDPYGSFDSGSLSGAFTQNTNWLRARAQQVREGN